MVVAVAGALKVKPLDELTADASEAGLYDTEAADYTEALAQARSKLGRPKVRYGSR